MTGFRNLVFEGGGVKGIAYAGALQELEKRGIISPIKKVAGTSAGAITASLVALGYRGDQAKEIITDTNFEEFMDNEWGLIRDFWGLIWQYGWNKGKKFLRWSGDLIRNAPGDNLREDITFGELHTRVESGESSLLKDLYVVGTNLSLRQPEVYSYEDTPDMQIRHAVRISMSFPLFFRAVKEVRLTRLNGKESRKKHVLVDGGMSWNYPIDIFDRGSDEGANQETLGLRLGTRKQHRMDPNAPQPEWHKIKHIINWGREAMRFLLETANRSHISDGDWQRTIFIDTSDVGVLEFTIGPQQKADLIKEGRKGVDEYFARIGGKVPQL